MEAHPYLASITVRIIGIIVGPIIGVVRIPIIRVVSIPIIGIGICPPKRATAPTPAPTPSTVPSTVSAVSAVPGIAGRRHAKRTQNHHHNQRYF
jgi:hypothetical protein